ncbi:MAG: 50S ribosomal protein L23 [Candidatus Wallbacteria bacterium HGW-Wallbacteria-1]|uniref:Large ribosomal subunit protein uL23 n=1 Tax=Candidatus Wallbacteria bacterium HGW-Wallbacteria-1 TaxID=2013854 RepID=A0A2N1PTB5_9BACT|nr:MAG: 50S ribosomal protein L23 [Candidatus Wallbacteria bacterium HGW-Wallbacteria-1]
MISRDILVKPLISEKSVEMMEHSKYCFKVDKRANKIQIAEAVEEIFKVKVMSVNTANYVGKNRRMGVYQGKRADWKKAIVTLKEGDSIPFFEGA